MKRLVYKMVKLYIHYDEYELLESELEDFLVIGDQCLDIVK